MYYVRGQSVQIDGNADLTLQYAIIERSRPSFRIFQTVRRHSSDGLIRLLDIVISLFALVFFAPVLVMVGLMVKAQDGGSVFYGQTRIGLGGRDFTCFKFRSMLTDSE